MTISVKYEGANQQWSVWDYRKFVFSGGEIQIRLDTSVVSPVQVAVMANLRSADEIIELVMLNDAIRRFSPSSLRNLYCPYFPYARQDRVCAPGEAFSAEVMASIINLCAFDSVQLFDVHSPVTLQKLNDSHSVPANSLIPVIRNENTILVSPDKGAVERVRECAIQRKIPMIVAEKIRNPDTGQITGTHVVSSKEGVNSFVIDYITNTKIDCSAADFFIVDDICDGGMTFIELAKVLRPLTNGKINLWVTHGIFSKGFDVFVGLIDNIYTANCFRTDVPDFVHI